MSSELSAKVQMALWWISSLAISIVCCSVLFVLFASYMADMKTIINENNARVDLLEKREDKILEEVARIHKHVQLELKGAAPAPANDKK